jgi:uncharacterized protein (TIGR03067 family)
MRTVFLIVLTAGLAVGADKPSADAVKKEWARLEGTWTLTRLEVDGKSLLKKGERVPKLTIKDGKITSADAPKGQAEDLSGIQLDPTRQPKTITIPNFKGGEPSNGVTALGIYDLKGDTLRVCVQAVETARLKERAGERPRKFDSKQGLLLVFHRSAK